MECTICLSVFKSPVALPCGHIHCSSCLTDYINKSSDAIKSKCPSCRAVFSLVTPDLTLVPDKYHQFIAPAVRRVYLDTGDARRTADELARQADELARLERRVQTLEREKTQLMESAEANIRRAGACAEGERRAILGREQAREEASTLRRRVVQLERQVEQFESPSRAPIPGPSKTSSPPRVAIRRSSDVNKRIRLTTSREELQNELRRAEDDESSSPAGSRPTRPLPRRPLATMAWPIPIVNRRALDTSLITRVLPYTYTAATLSTPGVVAVDESDDLDDSDADSDPEISFAAIARSSMSLDPRQRLRASQIRTTGGSD